MGSGAQLESLVSIVEEALLPRGFQVAVNKKLYDDNGCQLAEFDIEVTGRLGSADIAWLIECRDRPGDGPQSGDWIQQLAGRRDAFGFDKVTAVSTTSFTQSARHSADKLGVELREVNEEPPDLLGWLAVRPMMVRNPHLHVRSFTLNVPLSTDADMKQALEQLVGEHNSDDVIFRAIASGELISCAEAFARALALAPEVVDALEIGGPARPLRLAVEYTSDDDHLVLDTIAGPFSCRKITFEGDLSLVESAKDITRAAKYRRSNTAEPISDYVAFEPIKIRDSAYSIELHRLAETGEMVVAVKKTAA